LATSLPQPWIGSEQDSADSHEDRRFRHFLNYSHPSLDDEILECQTTVSARNSNQHKPSLRKAHSLTGSTRSKMITLRPPPPQHLATSMQIPHRLPQPKPQIECHMP
jgi:hypothetical protein